MIANLLLIHRYFLEAGYAVIFLYRTKTLQPFLRHCSLRPILEGLTIDDSDHIGASFSDDEERHLVSVLKRWREYRDRLHEISFTSLSEYLHLLRELSCNVLKPLGSRAMLYLAAAVSDFYIPSSIMVRFRA